MMRHISEALAELLEVLEAPTGGTVDLTAARIRRRVRHDDLWSAGAVGEQLAFDVCAGTVVAS